MTREEVDTLFASWLVRRAAESGSRIGDVQSRVAGALARIMTRRDCPPDVRDMAGELIRRGCLPS